MRIQETETPHIFLPLSGVPNLPSLVHAAGYIPVRCQHCGMVGAKNPTTGVIVVTQLPHAELARSCIVHQPGNTLHARITSSRTQARGGAFRHLLPGTAHRIIPDPEGAAPPTNGVWIAGPDGPVTVSHGEFSVIHVRVRRRASVLGA